MFAALRTASPHTPPLLLHPEFYKLPTFITAMLAVLHERQKKRCILNFITAMLDIKNTWVA